MKVENDGFELGAQRKLTVGNELPMATEALKSYIRDINNNVKMSKTGWGTVAVDTCPLCSFVSKEKIINSGDYNLTGERYKDISIKTNNKWPSIALSELENRNEIEFLRGSGLSKKALDPKGKYKCILYGELYTKYQPIIENVLSRTNEQGKVISQAGDLLIPGTTTADAMGIAIARSLNEDNVIIGSDINIIRTRNKIVLSDFLSWLFNYSLKKELAKYANGINILHLSNNNIRKIKIPLPPIEVQKEIVEEIESYQKVINGARSVVENWRPSFKIDSEWKKVKIGEITKLMTGGTPLTSKKEYYGGDIKWLVSGDINKNEIFDCDGRITELALKESNARLLPVNSVLIALNGQGKTRGTVAILRIEAACNQSLVSINPNRDKLMPEFLLYVLKGKYQEIRDINGDNQRGGLNMPIIRLIQVPLPTLEIQKQIVAKIQEEQKIVEANKKMIEIFEKKIEEKINEVWGK